MSLTRDNRTTPSRPLRLCSFPIAGALHRPGEVAVEDGDADLEVPARGVEVEVEGANGGKDPIHTHVLCMHVTVAIQVYFDLLAGGVSQEVPQEVGLCKEVAREGVEIRRPGQKQREPRSSSWDPKQGIFQKSGWEEICRGEQHGLVCRIDALLDDLPQ